MLNIALDCARSDDSSVEVLQASPLKPHPLGRLKAEKTVSREISAWIAGSKNPDRHLQRIAEGRFIVALLQESLVGFSDFDLGKGEVCGMFVAPSHMRQGIGRALLHAVATRAVRHGVGRLHLQSTLNAIGFYQAQGFVLDKMGSFPLRPDLCVPCGVMYKDLDSPSTNDLEQGSTTGR